MKSVWLAILCLGPAALVFGQLESDTLTIQSSRSISLQSDQVVFSVSVTSSLDATLDQIVASLAVTGITAADFSGVIGAPGNQVVVPPAPIPASGLLWSFTLGVPFAKMKGTAASLTALQSSLQKNNGMMLTFQVQGSRVSPELRQAQTCSVNDLVADAQVQAQKLAAAAGVVAGPILAISNGSAVGVSSSGAFSFLTIPVVRLGDFSPISSILSSSTFVAPTPFNCFAEVKFKLVRLH